MSIDVYKSMLLELEVKNILNTYFTNVYDSGSYYNFRCNVCGDSKINKFKKRGYILTNKDPWIYYCHNCQYTTNVETWMKLYFPSCYKNFIREWMKQKTKNTNIIEETNKKYKNIKTNKNNKANPNNEKENVSYFKKIKNFPNAIKFCKNRKIPEEIYTKWYYAIDGMYKNRIIIPFYNDKGKIYYYQGRSLYKTSFAKYMSRTGDHNSIYNFYLVNKNKPVIILEGPIDSIFVDNAVGVTGLKLMLKELDEFEHKYFLIDNDADGKKKSLKMLEQSKYVFNWTLFLKKYNCDKKIKDVNDFILHNKNEINKLTWDLIKDFFTNNKYDNLYFV